MADRKKVIMGLACCQTINAYCDECPYNHISYHQCTKVLIKEALELQKEQPEIVRCSECCRRASYDCPIYEGGDGMHDEPDDWFCGDGERRV